MGSQVLFWAATGTYAAAGLAYLAYLLGVRIGLPSAARAALTAALVMHTAEIARRGFAGLHPVSSVGEATGLLVWLLVAGFLLAQLARPLDSVGSVVAPMAAVLLLAAYLSPEFGSGSTQGLGVIGRVHIILAMVGASCFALGTAMALFYLVQERQLKRHTLGKAVRRGPSLETLDRLMLRSVQLGFPALTAAIATGAVWTARGATGVQAAYPLALAAWGAFGGLLLARQVAGWRGRRAAILTVGGFLAIVTVLGLYLVRGAEGG